MHCKIDFYKRKKRDRKRGFVEKTLKKGYVNEALKRVCRKGSVKKSSVKQTL